jgi:hypothetical protein
MPTLSAAEESALLSELLATNGGCELPCWWGIVPGETNVDTARNDLTSKGFRWGEDNSAGMRVADDFGVFIEFEIEGAIIQSIGASGGYLTGTKDSLAYSRAFARGWQRYSVAGMLNRHGIPTRVLVYSPFRADPGGGPSYHLLVFYESLGIEIEYRGNAEQINGGRYRACPDLEDIWEIGLFLYQPDRVDNVVERVLPAESVSYIAGPETGYEKISWEQATGTSLQFFYDTFRTTDNDMCIDFRAG